MISCTKAAWEALTPGQRRTMSDAEPVVWLGEPAEFLDGEGVAWLVWDDDRLTEDQLATFAALMQNPSLIPETEELADG